MTSESTPHVFLMAAGRGTRLQPLTDAVPKPVIPVGNEPAMGHLLRLAARHGMRSVTSNISWLADIMRDVFGDGSAYGVDLTWSHETELMGTAGGMKNCESSLRQSGAPTVVLSGDGLHEADLTGLVRKHRESGAVATLGLTRVADPSEYGVAVLDDSGRITGFQEKPSREDAKSDLANTGIYVFDGSIFDEIPEGEPYDFGNHLFPKLMASGAQLQGVEVAGYWNDIGNLNEMRDANFALLDGRCGDAADDQILVHPTATVSPDANLIAPCVIGAGATIAAGAQLRDALVLPGAEVFEDQVIVAGTVASVDGLTSWAKQLSTISLHS